MCIVNVIFWNSSYHTPCYHTNPYNKYKNKLPFILITSALFSIFSYVIILANKQSKKILMYVLIKFEQNIIEASLLTNDSWNTNWRSGSTEWKYTPLRANASFQAKVYVINRYLFGMKFGGDAEIEIQNTLRASPRDITVLNIRVKGNTISTRKICFG